MINEVSDVALNSYYANVFKGAYGYDPYEGPYREWDEMDVLYESDEEPEEEEIEL